MLSFVCSVGNIPLAAVLWNGGISFGGVIAFIYADLIVLPIINIYRKYYGWKATAFVVGMAPRAPAQKARRTKNHIADIKPASNAISSIASITPVVGSVFFPCFILVRCVPPGSTQRHCCSHLSRRGASPPPGV